MYPCSFDYEMLDNFHSYSLELVEKILDQHSEIKQNYVQNIYGMKNKNLKKIALLAELFMHLSNSSNEYFLTLSGAK